MSLKSLKYISNAIKRPEKDPSGRSSYAYMMEILGPYLQSQKEDDAKKLRDALLEQVVVTYPTRIGGGYQVRDNNTMGKHDSCTTCPGLIKCTMVLLNDPAVTQQNVLDWLTFLREVDKAAAPHEKAQLEDEALLYLFDMKHRFPKTTQQYLSDMVQRRFNEPMETVGIQDKNKRNFIEHLYYTGEPVMAIDILRASPQAATHYGALINQTMEDLALNRNISKNKNTTTHALNFMLSRNEWDPFMLQCMQSMNEKNIFSELLINAIWITNTPKYMEGSKDIIHRVYEANKDRLNSYIANNFETDLNANRFVVNNVITGNIVSDFFVDIANQAMLKQPVDFDSSIYDVAPLHSYLLGAFGLKINQDNDDLGGSKAKEMVESITDKGITKEALQNVFAHNKLAKSISKDNTSSLSFILSLEEMGVIDLNRKDERGWSMNSHLGKDGRARIKAMKNARDAHHAIDDIMRDIRALRP